MSAALGCSQVERLDEILTQRQMVADEYARRFSQVDGVYIPYIAKETTRMSWFVYVIRFAPSINRDSAMQWLVEQGVGCRPYFSPIHLQPFYKKEFGYREGDFPVTERVSRSTLAIPFYNRISAEEIGYVVAKIAKAVELFGK